MPFVHFTEKALPVIMAVFINDGMYPGMKRDKKRVEGEQWSDDQLRVYLNFNTYDGSDRDFHCLYRAYTRMNEDTFEQFIALFKSEGRNVQATNADGLTLAALISTHSSSIDYLPALT